MDEARTVLERLGRIDELRRDEAPAGVLLAEVRELLAEAESWVAADGAGTRARAAIEASKRALVAGERDVARLLTAP